MRNIRKVKAVKLADLLEQIGASSSTATHKAKQKRWQALGLFKEYSYPQPTRSPWLIPIDEAQKVLEASNEPLDLLETAEEYDQETN